LERFAGVDAGKGGIKRKRRVASGLQEIEKEGRKERSFSFL
jgi:hypothetical protein